MTSELQHSPERRTLLRGRMIYADVLRPPGALEAGAFEDTCTHCGDCAASCPQAIITADPDGFPSVDVSARGCDFCNVCADVCAEDAILPAQSWDVRAVVGDSCLSVQGIMCRTCEDHCDAAAIRFRPMTGGRAQPLIDLNDCIGCGACVAPCPADALTLQKPVATSATDDISSASLSQASEFQNVQYLRMPRSRDT